MVGAKHASVLPAAIGQPGPDTVLAFDFGTRRVGVAVGDLSVGIAHPAATIDAEESATRFAAIERLIAEWRPALLLVGLPLHMDGTEHEMTRLARRFANRLHGRFGIPVKMADERLTSEDAALALAEAGTRHERRRRVVDQVAAQRILQDFLDERKRERPGDPPLAAGSGGKADGAGTRHPNASCPHGPSEATP